MSELTLKDLIILEEPAVEQQSFRVVRHIMKGRGWQGFDDLLRFDDDLLTIFAASQTREIYQDKDIVLSFVATPNNTALFRGAFRHKGQISYRQYKKQYAGFEKYYNYRMEHNLGKETAKVFYDLEKIDLLAQYKNRLVIDWGKSTQAWVQRKIDKAVTEIYPQGFVSLFPGWDKVKITYQELVEIINNPSGNKDWFQYLSSHSGVYVILDEKTGKQYVGSAYGGEGLWTRWLGYARTGHNGNKALKVLASKDPNFADKFTFSLHHVFPKTVSKNEVIEYESMLKLKLGSRAFGLNEN